MSVEDGELGFYTSRLFQIKAPLVYACALHAEMQRGICKNTTVEKDNPATVFYFIPLCPLRCSPSAIMGMRIAESRSEIHQEMASHADLFELIIAWSIPLNATSSCSRVNVHQQITSVSRQCHRANLFRTPRTSEHLRNRRRRGVHRVRRQCGMLCSPIPPTCDCGRHTCCPCMLRL
jgi:hypothetical protein